MIYYESLSEMKIIYEYMYAYFFLLHFLTLFCVDSSHGALFIILIFFENKTIKQQQ